MQILTLVTNLFVGLRRSPARSGRSSRSRPPQSLGDAYCQAAAAASRAAPAVHSPLQSALVQPARTTRGEGNADSVWKTNRDRLLDVLDKGDEQVDVLRAQVLAQCKQAAHPLDAAVECVLDAARELHQRGQNPCVRPKVFESLYHRVFAAVLLDICDAGLDDFTRMQGFQRDFEELRKAYVDPHATPVSYEAQRDALMRYTKVNVASRIFGWMYFAEIHRGLPPDDARERAMQRCMQVAHEPWAEFRRDHFNPKFA